METKNTSTAKLFIGIDIHKRSWKIKTATDLFDGKKFSMKPESEELKKYVDKHYPNYEVYTAYEAGCCGYLAHRNFISYGWNSIVVNPADISKTGKSSHQKTDDLDAVQICRELKDERIQGIEIPSVEREQFRSLFRYRNNLTKKMRKIKTQIKMILLFFGIEIPQEFDNPNWSHAFRKWIKDIKFKHTTANFTIKRMLQEYEFTYKLIRETSNELRAYCRKYYKKDYNLLRSVPGIGGIVACGILAEMGDLRRFSFKQLAGYVGLCPNMHQSGDNFKTKGMSYRANRLMRSYFVEASWQVIRFDPVMQDYYRSHKGKESKKIIVKIARKLLSRTLAVIKTETPYQIGVVK